MRFWFILVAVVAVTVTLLLQPDKPITGDKVKLGDTTYDVRVLQAPQTKGPLLASLAYLMTESSFGPWLRRTMLNSNHLEMLRELAAQIKIPPLYFPLHRMGKSERESFDALASAADHSIDSAIHAGFGDNDESHVARYAALYRSGKSTPSDVMKRALQHVEDWEKKGFVLFSSIKKEDVLAQAAASDARHAAGAPLSVFDGVPVAFKDSIQVLGHTIYDGTDPSDPLNGQPSDEDDVIVARFRSLGAIIFGVTVMVEGGVSPLGYNTHFKGPVSPYSWNRYSGGSSSGSAVVVATGIVPVAVGFDGGGSIRVPACFSGVHGLAVTFGRIPYGDAFGTMTKAGPLAATTADAALSYAVMAANDERHFFNEYYDGGILGPPQPHLASFEDVQDLSDVRLGVFWDWYNDSDEDVRTLCNAALDYLRSRGATVVDIRIPHLQWLSLAHGLKISSEFAAVFDEQFHTHRHSLESNTKITNGIGSSVTALEVLSGEYLRAYAFDYVRDLFAKENLTAIVTPTVPLAAPILADDAKSHGESNTPLVVRVMKYVFLANFIGLPGYSVPVGFVQQAQDGATVSVPVGLQLIGNHWQEHNLLRLARSIELGHSTHLNKPSPLYSFNPFQV